MDMLPTALFWCLALWGLVGKRHRLLYLFFGSMPFGSFAVIPPALTAGLSFTPTPMIALLIIARAMMTRGSIDFLLGAALSPQRHLLLSLFWVTALISTVFMPRLFAGEVNVIPMQGLLTHAQALRPTPQNISQLAYVTISVVLVLVFTRLMRGSEMRQHALKALCLGAAITVATGVLDFLTQYFPLGFLLAPFRTAAYALLTDVEVLGGKRVVGLMPEASAFGGLCLSQLTLLYFLRPAIASRRLRERHAVVLLGLLLLFVWLSTSSAAYIGLALFTTVAAMEWCWRACKRPEDNGQRRRLTVELWLAGFAFVALSAVVLLKPSMLDPIFAMIDKLVLQKTSSHSFEERSMWTAVSWQALLDTYGLGVGLGGTRASNAVVAIASNVGFLGAAFYFAFLAQTLLRRGPAEDREGAALINAVRWAFLPGFVVSLLVGTSADFGVLRAFNYGLVASIAFQVQVGRWTNSPSPARESAARLATLLPTGRSPA